MYKIFISHSSKDKKIVDVIVDELLENGMGFNHDDIFYTSGDSMGIKTGEEWRSSIKDSLLNCEVILLIITPNYKESEICLNEMGAAWATHDKVVPIVVPTITFSTIGVTFDVKQGIKLTDSAGLDELRDTLHNWTSTEVLPTARWNAKRDEAKMTIEDYINKNPFSSPISRAEVKKLEKEAKEAKANFRYIVEEKNKLKEYICELEKVKDKEDIVKVKRNAGMISDYDVFEDKANKLNQLFNKIDSNIVTIIFNEYTQNTLPVSQSTNEFHIAVADRLIDEEGSLDTNHPIISSILSELHELENFFVYELSEESYDIIQSQYPDILLDFKTLKFWENVLNITMYYER